MSHSTETSLLKTVNDLFLSLNEDSMSMLALLEFSSAFDTIDHSILERTLHTDSRLTDTFLQWYTSYLTDRKHYISLSNNCSVLAPALWNNYLLSGEIARKNNHYHYYCQYLCWYLHLRVHIPTYFLINIMSHTILVTTCHIIHK